MRNQVLGLVILVLVLVVIRFSKIPYRFVNRQTIHKTNRFYQRVSIASCANGWYSQRRNVRPSVRLSICPSHSGIVSKRRKLAS